MSDLRWQTTETAPPPNATLRALVDNARPVSTRRPMLQLLLWLACVTVLGAVVGHHVGLRLDHDALPQAPFFVAAALWTLAIVIGASFAFVPPARQVLPSLGGARAALIVVVALALTAGVGLLGNAPGLTRHLDGDVAWRGIWHCERFGILLALPSLLLAWVLVLRRIPMGGAIVGATVGAAAGAVSGLVLHFICTVGGVQHALFGHVALVLIGAALGALSARR